MGKFVLWVIVITLWFGATYAIGEALGVLDERSDCDPPTCQVSPQDAQQPH